MKFNKVNVIGYYQHDNLGDEQYKYTISYLLRNLDKTINVDNINFIDCDKIKPNKLDPKDFYIIGGGDVLIDYFLDKLQFFNSERFSKTKIVSISSAFPYHNYNIVSKMTFIDYFFIRNRKDVEYLNNIFRNRVFYLPDTCFFTKRIEINNIKIIHKQPNALKNILICPTMFSKDRKINQDFKLFMYNLILELTNKYNVYIFPFGERDETLCSELYSSVYITKTTGEDYNKGSIFYLSSKNNKVDYIISFFKSVKIDYSIPMRYHSVLLSTIYNIPIFPIFSTIKIQRFLEDINWDFYYYSKEEFYLDRALLLLSEFFKVNLKTKLNIENIKIENDLYKGVEDMNCIFNNYKKNSTVLKNIDEIKLEVESFIKNNELNNETKEFLVKLVSYRITNNTNSIYNWGLFEKMFKPDFNWHGELSWVINDFYLNICSQGNDKEKDNDNGLFNLDYLNQEDYSKAHRSGWDYVYRHLKPYSNKSNEVILDLYIDRTFGWDYEINSYLNMIPYKKSWYGFIHHTFNTEFSKYNIYEYFEKNNFLKSLHTCKGLFVLSRYLQRQLLYYMKLFDFNIPVYYITHPTEMDVEKFTICKFNIKEYKLLHIGGWLRNIYSFYKLSGIKNKYLLKGKHMNHYIPPKDIDIICNNDKELDIYKHCSKNCSTDNFSKNQWIKDLEKDLKNTIDSVKIINHISNEEYDDLLSRNVVFINLHDGSAVNTVIECIVRNTPIIINKTEFTVEILGENYPLFYNNYPDNFYETNKEIKTLLKYQNILKAHLYLKCLNKKKYSVEYFVENLLKHF